MTKLVAWGRLLRLSLAPTAVADVVAGIVFAGQGRWTDRPVVGLLGCLSSLCVYHGGMVLNDWSDRREDARARPDRPLASGAISARAALAVSIVCLCAGPALALTLDPWSGVTLLAVSVLAAFYDLAGRGAWLGPLLLAACRAGNLLAGMFLGFHSHPELPWSASFPLLALAAPLAYGAYVLCVGRIGRMEDAAEGTPLRPQGWIVCACAVLACAPRQPFRSFDRAPGGPTGWMELDWFSTPDGIAWARIAAQALVVVAIVAPLRQVLTVRRWATPDVLRTMGMLLRRLLVFTAALALASDSRTGTIAAALILCGYPLSFALRKVFPPS